MSWEQAMQWAGMEYRRKNGRRQRVEAYHNGLTWLYRVRNAQRGPRCTRHGGAMC